MSKIEEIFAKFVAGELPDQPAADIAAWEATLLVCVRRRDWHGVSDAANEIRVLEAIRDAKAKAKP